MTQALPLPGSSLPPDSAPTDLRRDFDRSSRFQAAASAVLNDLLRVPAEQADHAIDHALAGLASACGCERAFVCQLQPSSAFVATHEWAAPGSGPLSETPGLDERWRAALEQDEAICIPDMAELPADRPERVTLDPEGIRSLVTVPMFKRQRLAGYLRLESCRGRFDLRPDELVLVRAIALAIGTLLADRQKEREIASAEQALQDEHHRLKATLAAMPDLTLEMDGEGRFVRWHAGWLSNLSTESELLIGKRVDEALPPEVAAVAHRVMREVDTKGWAAGYEYQMQTEQGLRWHSLSAASLPPVEKGAKAGYLVVIRDTTEAHAQRKQVEQLGLFAQLTTNLVIVTDADQHIEWVNAAFEAQTGYPLAEAQGLALCAVLHCREGQTCPSDRLHAMMQAGELAQGEILATMRDGRAVWYDISIQPLTDPDGTITGYMAVGSDISAHKRQEAELAATAEDALAARRQLAAAVDVLPDAFAYFDADDRLVLCNARYRDYYPGSAPAIRPGATFEEIIRQGVNSGIIVDAKDREEEWIAERMAAHRLDTNEQEQQLSDGRWLRVLERRTPDGGRVGLRVDITALKRAEQSARSDLTAAMDASQDGIAIGDPDGNYVYMNPAHREMFGITSDSQILGRSWRELYSPEVADHIASVAFPALRRDGGWRGELIGRRFDGSDLPQEVSLTMKADGGIICISRDISKRIREQNEQTRLREELHMAQRREVISQLASGLAHDLNNLLAAIGGSATLIRDLRLEPTEAHAHRIIAATEQASALVRRFLSLGKRQSNRLHIDLRASLREAADLLRPSLPNQTRLVLSLPESPVEIEADPTDILQVVLNLVINARDAIAASPPRPNGYEITLSMCDGGPAQLAGPFAAGTILPDRRYVCMAVTDNGPGIDRGTQARVFEPYFSTKGAGGTGLGLAIVTGVLAANHGAITLDSEPGRGTRFTVFWPVEARTPAAAAPVDTPVEPRGEPPVEAARTGRLAGRLILVVDDNADVLRVLSAFLEQAGAEVVPCADPRDALAAVRDDPGMWHLMVTDYDMPHLTGSDLAEAAHEVAPDLPILLVTALPDWRSRAGSASPRFAGVLGKPLSRGGLVAAAEAAIREAPPS